MNNIETILLDHYKDAFTRSYLNKKALDSTTDPELAKICLQMWHDSREQYWALASVLEESGYTPEQLHALDLEQIDLIEDNRRLEQKIKRQREGA